MKITAVIGLGFGDEGKGKVVDRIARDSNAQQIINIRYSGGAQAAHHVYNNGTPFCFSMLGSGSFNEDVVTYLSPDCMVNLDVLQTQIEKIGRPVKVYVDPRCLLTTPIHILDNILNKQTMGNGTCGMGIGATKEYWLKYGNDALRFADIFDQTTFMEKLELLFNRIVVRHQHNPNMHKHKDLIDTCSSILPIYHNYWEAFYKNDNIVSSLLRSIPKFGKSEIIFESSQGMLLDEWWGTYPHNTWSSVGFTNVLKVIQEIPRVYLDMTPEVDLIGVTRSYNTRHGNGPMYGQPYETKQITNPYEQNVKGKFQGEFRTDLLNIGLIDYSWHCLDYEINQQAWLEVNKSTHVTCLDVKDSEYIVAYAKDFDQLIPNKYGYYINGYSNKSSLYVEQPYKESKISKERIVDALVDKLNMPIIENTGV